MTSPGVRLALASIVAVLGLVTASAMDRAPASVSRGRASIGVALACPPCDDHNPCTVDSCDGTTGTCRFDPLSCDDGNPCTTDLCQTIPSNPGCAHVRVADATPCDDGSSCTLEDSCSSGFCVPGRILDSNTPCDDGNPCTLSDVCDPFHQCVGTPVVGGACDDGNACTREDQCVSGPDGTALCEGTGQDCSDGNLCTEDRCDPATGTCLHPPVSCADGNACTTDVCDPSTGLCRRDNVAGTCFDGLYCTTGETCVGGNCVGAQPIVCPQYQCGTSFCLEEDRECRWRPVGSNSCPPAGQCSFYTCENGACRINNISFGSCTLPGFCGIAQCIRGDCQPAVTLPCADDGNPCTDEVCPQGGCTHPPKPDGTSCGDACSNGICHAGACLAGTPPSCDDSNPCTVDSCDPVTGCRHAPLDCDDGNACTRDLCSTTTGQCVHNPENNIPCPGSGNDACHTAYCVQGACTGFAPVSCDDGSTCTADSCDVGQGGCVHRTACDDGNTCTVDNCSASGACQHIAYPVGFPCSDNNACTTHDLCAGPVEARVCAGTGPSCDDGNPCTADVGVAEGGTCVCDHLPVEGACCSGGGPRSCDDGNPCTADRCAPDIGCVHDGPAEAAKEVCLNGVDDDCDGLVDERETLPMCSVRPVVMRDGGTLQAFSVTCRWSPICGGAPAPVPLDAIGTVWLSAADLLFDARDNEPLPDPFASCPTAIVENPARRMVTDAAVTFVFDPAGDGVCGTSGGGRPGLVKALADVPDGKLARVCVKWRTPAMGDTERCGAVLVRHGAGTEPQPLSPGDEEGLLRPAP